MSGVDFTLELSSQALNLLSDKKRIQQVLLSCLENAVHQAGSQGVINLHFSTKPLNHTDINSKYNTANNLQIFDFTKLLVCLIDFQPHASFEQKTKLHDLSLTKIFEEY